ncbi:hypothetical protein [Amycolatopsis taiwanensis]|uniref:Uncharacterized protein n=1 Tax=Amycolatopsis taiwanensis TaxID=342230 RepID=A0A9W6VIM3_9PSEU|nr:hypothetical protein [Amycolatopsis taiwanensis]GLY69845.1 hypothetical protein Atai01_64640 [Amycolatopsis taiwanensis]
MHEDWLFDRVQAEVAYRTEELHKTRGSSRYGGKWWRKLGRREAAIAVPEQRWPSRDQRPRVGTRAG